MAVITSQILDISNSSAVTFRQWANNTNKIVTDVNSVNNALVPIVANVNTLKTTTTRLSANVVTLISDVAGLSSATSSPNIVGLTSLSANGIIVKTGVNTMVSRTIVGPATGLTVNNGNGLSGNPTFVLANDLAALEALGSTGFAVRTAADTWAQRSLAQPAAGITISNNTGAGGDPTFALANDLAAIEAMVSTGFAVRTATDTWSQRTIIAPSTGVTISNGNGVAGNPTISLVNDLAAIEALGGTGFAVRISTDTWAQRGVVGTAPVSVINNDGVSGNPTISVNYSTTNGSGVVELATTAETIAGADTARVVTPAGFSGSFGTYFNAYLPGYIGSTLQGYDAATVKSNVTKTFSVGYTNSTPDLGTTSSGTWTPNMATSNFVLMRNGGAFTLAAPSADGSMVIFLYNTAPGAVTFSGFTKVSGDSLNVNVGHGFYLFITNIAGQKVCYIQRMIG